MFSELAETIICRSFHQNLGEVDIDLFDCDVVALELGEQILVVLTHVLHLILALVFVFFHEAGVRSTRVDPGDLLGFRLGLLHQKCLQIGDQIKRLIARLSRELLVQGNDVLADAADVFAQAGVEVILDGVVRPIKEDGIKAID